MVNVYPLLDRSKTNRKGVAPIIIIVDFNNRKVARKSTGQKIEPEYWNYEKACVKDNHPNAPFINAIIKNKIEPINSFVLKRLAQDQQVTKEIIQLFVSGSGISDFFDYAEWVIENKKIENKKKNMN